jgi:glycosyltransferase involved in cell wall biosynthesis
MVKDVFVVMPAYNAGLTIERVFERFPPEVDRRISQYVVVDDGSTDNTSEAIARLQKRIPKLVALRHEVNRGYGGAEKTLLSHAVAAGCGLAVLVHSDGQYSPEKIPEMLALFDRDEADIVMGSRMLGGGALRGRMPFYKFVANKALTSIENWAFGMNMAEYHSGFLSYSRRALDLIPFTRLSDSFDFDLEMIVMARIKGLRVKEVAIPTIYADEVSHLKPIQYGLNVLNVVWDYKRGRYHAL